MPDFKTSPAKGISTALWLCSQLASHTGFYCFIVTSTLLENIIIFGESFRSKVYIVGNSGEVQEEAVGSIVSSVDLRLQEEGVAVQFRFSRSETFPIGSLFSTQWISRLTKQMWYV